jgi:hypothetical protein
MYDEPRRSTHYQSNKDAHGEYIADKVQEINDCLLAVEKRYQAYFATINSKYSKEGEFTPARLEEFLMPEYNSNGYGMHISSVLPENIAAKCLACQTKVLGSNNA